MILSCVMRKPAISISENKGADQLRGNHTADQHLCFRYIDSIITLLSKSQISSPLPFSVDAQPGLCPIYQKPRRQVFSCHGSFNKCTKVHTTTNHSKDQFVTKAILSPKLPNITIHVLKQGRKHYSSKNNIYLCQFF